MVLLLANDPAHATTVTGLDKHPLLIPVFIAAAMVFYFGKVFECASIKPHQTIAIYGFTSPSGAIGDKTSVIRNRFNRSRAATIKCEGNDASC